MRDQPSKSKRRKLKDSEIPATFYDFFLKRCGKPFVSWRDIKKEQLAVARYQKKEHRRLEKLEAEYFEKEQKK